MKLIPLTKGMFAKVSDEDYEFLMQWKWQFNGRYAVRKSEIKGQRFTVYMHRLIMGVRGKTVIDHTNNDGLDNQRSNLRHCTYSQNRAVATRKGKNKTGYIGVFQSKKLWRARLQVSGKPISLGYFTDPIDAAKAYDKAAKEYLGEFAKTNF